MVLSFIELGRSEHPDLDGLYQLDRRASRDPVTGNALLVTRKIMLFTWHRPDTRSACCSASSPPEGRSTGQLLAVLYFLPLLLSSAAVAIAFKALLDPNFGMSRAFHLPR